MIFQKKPKPADIVAEEAPEENPFAEIAAALVELEHAGELPEGFDLGEATQDRAFAELLQEFEPRAAVRIYAAERRADEAESNAKARISEKIQARSALPKSQRTAQAVSPTPDYMSMSKEAFHALEQQYKSAAHNGRRVHI